MNPSVKYVGLDVHKDTIAVAVADDGKRAEVREHGEIVNTPAALGSCLAGQALSCTFAMNRALADMAFSGRSRLPGIAAPWLHVRVSVPNTKMVAS